MSLITLEIFEAAKKAFLAAQDPPTWHTVDEPAGLRDALAAVEPLIVRAALLGFAEKLMERRDGLDNPDVFSDLERHGFRGDRRGLELGADMARAAATEETGDPDGGK